MHVRQSVSTWCIGTGRVLSAVRTPLGRAAAAATAPATAAAPAATPAAAAAAVGSGAGLAPAAAGGHAEGDAPLRREEVQEKTWYQLEPAFPRGGACTVSVTRPRPRHIRRLRRRLCLHLPSRSPARALGGVLFSCLLPPLPCCKPNLR